MGMEGRADFAVFLVRDWFVCGVLQWDFRPRDGSFPLQATTKGSISPGHVLPIATFAAIPFQPGCIPDY